MQYPRIYLGMMVTVISSPCHSLLRLMYMVELATSASRPSSRVANLVTNHRSVKRKPYEVSISITWTDLHVARSAGLMLTATPASRVVSSGSPVWYLQAVGTLSSVGCSV